jgi:hypothetical protein
MEKRKREACASLTGCLVALSLARTTDLSGLPFPNTSSLNLSGLLFPERHALATFRMLSDGRKGVNVKKINR